MTSRCRLLTWDSEFFGLRISRLEGDTLHGDESGPILEWCAAHRVDCLYFLANSRCPETAAFAENAGFGLKDMRLTLEWKSGFPSDPPVARTRGQIVIRDFRDSDLDALVRLARVSHVDSRFFFDANFGRANAERLFETWIRQACAGGAARVLIGEAEEQPVGYISCDLQPHGVPSIGLAAVDSRFQGQGIGGNLLQAALRWFVEQGSTQVRVVTQGRNVQAQRLYQNAGFSTRSVECWYHKWFR